MLDAQLRTVLAAYEADLECLGIDPLAGAGGFSGAQLWRLETPRGPCCLRRWSPEHPSRERLEYIHSVLVHVASEGFRRVPVPYQTRGGDRFVAVDSYLWEVTPWLPGSADYHRLPCPRKLKAAMTALAEFHLAAVRFPPSPLFPTGGQPISSPGMRQRCERLRQLCDGGLRKIQGQIGQAGWPELALRAKQICELFPQAVRQVQTLTEAASRADVPLQPCIRDVWHDHLLYVEADVSGIVDFGALRPENVAADVARLLGSMVYDDPVGWAMGLTAYQAVRPLSEAESLLVTAFDRTTVLMGGLQWLDWIYCQGRQFEDREAVITRLDETTSRLVHLALTRGA